MAQKNALSVALEERRGWLQADCKTLSMVQRCALAGQARSTYYYELMPERAENLALMRVIDRLYLQRPFYGVPWMTDWLQTLGYAVNHKRVERLMRVMDLQAIVPGLHTSRPHPKHLVCPYLLRDLAVERPNQVWCADITYVPMRRGFLYQVGSAGLVQPLRAGVGAVEHLGGAVLSRGFRPGVREGPARDLQYGPRGTVYERRVLDAAGGGWGSASVWMAGGGCSGMLRSTTPNDGIRAWADDPRPRCISGENGSSYLILRHSRSTKMLSSARPLLGVQRGWPTRTRPVTQTGQSMDLKSASPFVDLSQTSQRPAGNCAHW